MENKPYLSAIVPLYNEEGNVRELHRCIVSACEKLGRTFEVVFVDDGSDDKMVEECKKLHPLKLIQFRKNFGQTAAFDAGIKNSLGEIIVTMDGDLQNDPDDIKLLLAEMEKGYDVVAGWRWERKDPPMKKIFSRIANILRKFFVRDKIHDSGCSLKTFRRECFENIDLFGEMHRFINEFYKKYFNIYVNYHRPSGFSTDTVDAKGKVKKKYDRYLMPYEKLLSLLNPQQYLKEGVTIQMIGNIAQEKSDNEYAALMQKEKVKLLKSFKN